MVGALFSQSLSGQHRFPSESPDEGRSRRLWQRALLTVSLMLASTALVVAPASLAAAQTPGWSAPLQIDPGNVFPAGSSVSCPTISFCMAVDTAGNFLTFNGTSWSGPIVLNSGVRFGSVSCPTDQFCAVV